VSAALDAGVLRSESLAILHMSGNTPFCRNASHEFAQGGFRSGRNEPVDPRRLIQITVAVFALLVVMAVLVLPWRRVLALPESVRIGGRLVHPRPIGAHLYQMDLQLFLVGLLALAIIAAITGLVVDRGPWPSRVMFASGCGIVMLTLYVQQSYATQVFIGSSQIQPGNAVALVAGLVIACVAASRIFRRPRSSDGALVV